MRRHPSPLAPGLSRRPSWTSHTGGSWWLPVPRKRAAAAAFRRIRLLGGGETA